MAIALGTIPTLAVGSIAYYFAASSIEQQNTDLYKSLVTDLQNQVNVFMGDRSTISTSSGVFSVYTAAPVKDRVTGATIDFVRARMPVEVLKQLLEDYTTQGSQYYLLNN